MKALAAMLQDQNFGLVVDAGDLGAVAIAMRAKAAEAAPVAQIFAGAIGKGGAVHLSRIPEFLAAVRWSLSLAGTQWQSTIGTFLTEQISSLTLCDALKLLAPRHVRRPGLKLLRLGGDLRWSSKAAKRCNGTSRGFSSFGR
jgi:hypothetical protein